MTYPEFAARRAEPARSSGDESAMRLALEAARRAGLAGEPPIGACLVCNGRVLGVASNSVIAGLDVTAHAEINLIRNACRSERSLELSGCELFATVEPCPMCVAASYYARIGRIVYGASLEDLQAVTGMEMLAGSRAATADRLTVTSGCLRTESLALLQAWSRRRRG